MGDNLTKKGTVRKKSTPGKLTPEKVIQLKQLNPNLTTTQIAKLNDVDHSAIVRCFQRYGINKEHLEAFKMNRGDILAGIQETVAASLTVEDIKGASVRDRTILLGTLYDKERLERGQSTQNVATILASAVVEATAARTGIVTQVITQEDNSQI